MGYLAKTYTPEVLSALNTDQYQLTMAQSYFNQGRQEEEAVFYMHWRSSPFGGYTVASGLEGVIDYLQNFKFTDEDINYLKTKKEGGARLFTDEFLDYIKNTPLDIQVDAVPEGTVIPEGNKGPVIRVKGNLVHCQLVETAILNIVNSSSIVTTKAAKVVDSGNITIEPDVKPEDYQAHDAKPKLFADFSTRRRPDLGFQVDRAAHIGGFGSTSNTAASKILGIPAVGTMAHAYIMGFQQEGLSNKDVELKAFKQWFDDQPNNSVLLVDTFDPIEGVKNAIQAAKEKGTPLKGIRLDSAIFMR